MLHRQPPVRFFVTVLFIICSAALAARVSATDTNAAGLRFVQDSSTMSILDGNRPILRYRYAGVPKKPYVDQLFSPSGVQILRDSPSDHKHHHGLMFALSVDGINFWEEHFANSGREVQKSLTSIKDVLPDGIVRVGFGEDLDWVAPGSEKPLLLEQRSIGVLNSDDLGATLAQWRCRLQTPPGKDKMTLGGDFYFGLGMRLLPSMEGGRFFNADDQAGEKTDKTGPFVIFVKSKWCAYSAKADGKPVTVAIFDGPANYRPATMFTLTSPFTYLAATLNEWREPIVVKANKPLLLDYAVALWDGAVDKATVEKLYQRWLTIIKR